MWTYNHVRPNMVLGGITPSQKLKQFNEGAVYSCPLLNNGGITPPGFMTAKWTMSIANWNEAMTHFLIKLEDRI